MKRPRGLGRGLDALIPPSEHQTESAPFNCPVDDIVPLEGQPRRRFDPQKLEEMVQTVREKGVLSPVLVRPYGRGYQLVSGERRWRAAKAAGLDQIPVIVREISDREALELSLIENIQREDLTPLEEARAYQALLTLHDMTHEELARRIGKDRSTITNAIRLLRLSPSVQSALEEGLISAGHARALQPLSPEAQERLLKAIVNKGLSVRATEDYLKSRTRTHDGGAKPPVRLSPQLEDIRTRLRRTLSTQVQIVEGKRKGKIVIEYYNQEDLRRLIDLLLSPERIAT
jgi:ParB family chromosome partitioning protein